MEYSIYNIIQIIGAVAFFIYGMKKMSEGIQRAAGSPMRKILRSITQNKYLGVLIGFFTTATIQSSTAITVLIVSFASAELITVLQSVGLIMGANIGTTVTTWLIAFLDYQVELYSFCLPLLAIGVPMTFRSRGTLKYWGEFIIGLSFLLLSLYYLQISVPEIDESNGLFETIQRLGTSGFASKFLFVFIGILFAFLLQSSSAVTAVVLTMCMKGYISFDLSLFMILGSNIGTTFTAEIAAWVGNANAKRTARIHSLFNVIGVLYMLFLMPLMNSFIVYIMEGFSLGNPNENLESTGYGLAIFHTAFNVLNTIVLLPFAGILVKLSTQMIPHSEEEKQIYKSKFLKTSIKTPELSVIEFRKTISKYHEIVNRMLHFNQELFNNFVPKEQSNLHDKIIKYEKISHRIHLENNENFSEIFNEELTVSTGRKLKALFNINKELHQIALSYRNISDIFDDKRVNKIWLSPNQRLVVIETIQELIEFTESTYQSILATTEVHKKLAISNANYQILMDKKENRLDSARIKTNAKDKYNMKGALSYKHILDQLYLLVDKHHNIIQYLD